ncbi:MAG: hypothetical protein J6S13_04475 [Clostridia bacterium]|nr:hypothetical protein [Clostridia bacterium]
MKLKYTTKLFVVVNAIVLVFRTLQIVFLTEADRAFLKTDMLVVNIIGTVISVLSLAALFYNASLAVRQPEKINCSGLFSAVAAGVVGCLYMLTGLLAAVEKTFGWQIILLIAVLATVSAALMVASALSEFKFPKWAAILPVLFWTGLLVVAYINYTERALRVRTVYEVFAVCFMILFSLAYGKAISGVKPSKNFRFIYPLGLVASSLCMASVIPEAIATLVSKGENVASSPIPVAALVAGAVFTGFFTVNTFKKSNTVHPKKKTLVPMQSDTSDITDKNEQ